MYSTKPESQALKSSSHKSKMGYHFDFSDSCWKLDNSNTINFELLPELENEVLSGFKETLCRYAEEMSARYTINIFNFCNGLMIQDTELDIIIKTNEVKNEFKTNFYK